MVRGDNSLFILLQIFLVRFLSEEVVPCSGQQ